MFYVTILQSIFKQNTTLIAFYIHIHIFYIILHANGFACVLFGRLFLRYAYLCVKLYIVKLMVPNDRALYGVKR